MFLMTIHLIHLDWSWWSRHRKCRNCNIVKGVNWRLAVRVGKLNPNPHFNQHSSMDFLQEVIPYNSRKECHSVTIQYFMQYYSVPTIHHLWGNIYRKYSLFIWILAKLSSPKPTPYRNRDFKEKVLCTSHVSSDLAGSLLWLMIPVDRLPHSISTVTHLEGDAEEDLKDFQPSDKVESA